MFVGAFTVIRSPPQSCLELGLRGELARCTILFTARGRHDRAFQRDGVSGELRFWEVDRILGAGIWEREDDGDACGACGALRDWGMKVGIAQGRAGLHRPGIPCCREWAPVWEFRPVGDAGGNAMPRWLRRRRRGRKLVVVEGVMGLFDGATADEGSTADVAAATGWPVVLVVDAGAMAASAAAVVHGFASFRDDVDVAGRHLQPRRERPARGAARPRRRRGSGFPSLGCIRRDSRRWPLPDRHLGLVQASEHSGFGGISSG